MEFLKYGLANVNRMPPQYWRLWGSTIHKKKSLNYLKFSLPNPK